MKQDRILRVYSSSEHFQPNQRVKSIISFRTVGTLVEYAGGRGGTEEGLVEGSKNVLTSVFSSSLFPDVCLILIPTTTNPIRLPDQFPEPKLDPCQVCVSADPSFAISPRFCLGNLLRSS